MKYSTAQIEKIKREVNAVSILSARMKVTFDGKEGIASCPFHSEKTPSFKIFKKDGTWLCHCFGCGVSKNVIQVVQHLDKCSFEDAVTKVIAQDGWQEEKELVESTFCPVLDGQDKKYLTMPFEGIKTMIAALGAAQDARNFLLARGIAYETAQSLNLGFVQDLSSLNSKHPWAKSGWLVIPYLDSNGIVTCLKYRSLVGKKSEDGKISGILRAPKMETTLYNLNACNSFEDCFVVEGEPDVWVMIQAGFPSVGLPSAEYTPSPAERDRLVQANRIFLAGDSDQPGQNAMKKLWTEFKDRCYLIEWPAGCKDANDTLIKHCGGDTEKFMALVEQLKIAALEKPMQFMYDLKHTLKTSVRTPPFENPARMHFPWPTIDKWTPVVPGDIMTMFATESKTGKSTWLMNILLHNAVKYAKVVVNYSAEIMPPEYARRVTAYLTRKDRLHLTSADYDEAIKRLGDARFFNGYMPGANYKTVIELLVAAKKRLGADIFVIDHIHFLTRGTRDENSALSEAMRLLKDFAFDYNVIVIVVGQPRKMASNQRGREATAQDAKSSEAFGSDASQVFILHRDRLKDQDEGDPIFSPITKVKLDYSRESETKFTTLHFEGASCVFYEMGGTGRGQ